MLQVVNIIYLAVHVERWIFHQSTRKDLLLVYAYIKTRQGLVYFGSTTEKILTTTIASSLQAAIENPGTLEPLYIVSRVIL